MKYADLVAVLDFMYQGEVNVAQEELNTFLQIAEELKIKGLTQNSPNPNLYLNQKLHKSHQSLKAGSVLKKCQSFAVMAQEPSHTRLNDSSKHLHNENEDKEIQEILPEKTESAGEKLDTHTLAEAQAIGNQEMETTALIENIAIYGEDSEDFDDHNDKGHSLEQRGMQDNKEENTGEMQM